MRRIMLVVLVGLLVLSAGSFHMESAEAAGGHDVDIRHAIETAMLPYEPMVVAPEDRRPYLPVLVRPGYELPSIDELRRTGVRIPFDLEAVRSTWPASLRLVTVKEALSEEAGDPAEVATEAGSEVDRQTSVPQ